MLASERAAAWAAHLAHCGDAWVSNTPLDASHVDREKGEVYLDGYVLRRGTKRGNYTPWTGEPVRDGGDHG